ncbi:MAG: non-ribosomal peptide synthetase [Terriglobales bacterium]
MAQTALPHEILDRPESAAGNAPGDGIRGLFAEQVKLRPLAVALEYEGRLLTYSELDQRSNRVARRLQKEGIGPERIVALYSEPGIEMMVAILGTLKAGAAYMPLDPAYPTERLSYMVKDSGAALLLAQNDPAGIWEKSQGPVLFLKEAEENTEELTGGACAGNIAYIIYTSGSTGKPKGVCLTYAGLYNLAQAQIKAFQIHPGSVVLQFASLSFDAAVSEWATALFSGARLLMAPKEKLLPGGGLLELLRDGRVNVVTFPPSTAAVLKEEGLPELKTLIVAGEACAQELVRRWGAGRRMLNAYGPTEVTVCASISEELKPEEGRTPPIGRALSNVKLYVLDEEMSPVAKDQSGELYIGGTGLARGYLNRAGLTAEKFVPNPFSSNRGERLYRSGDRVKWREDGQLEFLGRLDEQIKIRGYRIELGEIESVLNQHDKVQLSAVALRKNSADGSTQLVAYVAGPLRDKGFTAVDLRRYLGAHLPEYMMPSRIVILEKLPQTPNGKVDRQALPKPDEHAENASPYVSPGTPLEESLLAIWEEVLSLKSISVQDDFFDLGGYSLLATQVMSRVKQVFSVKLSVKELYKAPTVRGLATVIQQEMQKQEQTRQHQHGCANAECQRNA